MERSLTVHNTSATRLINATSYVYAAQRNQNLLETFIDSLPKPPYPAGIATHSRRRASLVVDIEVRHQAVLLLRKCTWVGSDHWILHISMRKCNHRIIPIDPATLMSVWCRIVFASLLIATLAAGGIKVFFDRRKLVAICYQSNRH